MNIKKALIVFALAAAAVLPLSAQSEELANESELSYKMAPVYKVIEAADSYAVIYGKYGAKLGTLVIPKQWANYETGAVRKLKIRALPKRLNPYVTVVTKNGDFYKVILTVPSSRTDKVWSFTNGKKIDGEVSSITLDI